MQCLRPLHHLGAPSYATLAFWNAAKRKKIITQCCSASLFPLIANLYLFLCPHSQQQENQESAVSKLEEADSKAQSLQTGKQLLTFYTQL